MEYAARVNTLADRILPQKALWRHVMLIVGFSLVNVVAAQIAIPLPFTPVPLTAQTVVVLLTGLLLGSRLGSLAMLAYLAQGAAGLPVFAGGHAGLAWLLGPTGGYLVSFVAVAYVVGLLAERGWDRKYWKTALAMLAGTVMIWAGGALWLANFVGLSNAFAMGVVPFVSGDLIKLVLAAALLPTGWKLLSRRSFGW
jgi:biotin transport system substrate-specific component